MTPIYRRKTSETEKGKKIKKMRRQPKIMLLAKARSEALQVEAGVGLKSNSFKIPAIPNDAG